MCLSTNPLWCFYFEFKQLFTTAGLVVKKKRKNGPQNFFFQFHSPSMGVALSISRDWNHTSFSLLSEWYLIAHQKHLRAQQKQPDSPPEIFLKGYQLISVELTDFSRMPPRNLTVLVPLTYLKKLQWPGTELGPTDQDLSTIPSELSWLLEMMSVKWTIYFAYFLNQYIKHYIFSKYSFFQNF